MCESLAHARTPASSTWHFRHDGKQSTDREHLSSVKSQYVGLTSLSTHENGHRWMYQWHRWCKRSISYLLWCWSCWNWSESWTKFTYQNERHPRQFHWYSLYPVDYPDYFQMQLVMMLMIIMKKSDLVTTDIQQFNHNGQLSKFIMRQSALLYHWLWL